MQTALSPTGSALPSIGPIRSRTTRPATGAEGAALGSTLSVAKDESVFSESDRAAYVYKVVFGVVRTTKLLSDGRRQIDAFHLPGDFFGFESGEEYGLTAEAATDVVLVAYRRRGPDQLACDGGPLALQIVSAMMFSLERARRHVLLLGRKSAVERIASFLLDLAGRLSGGTDHDRADPVDLPDQLDLPMSRGDIADHLGLTIETVSRSFTQLERMGLIEVPANRRSIVLKNTAALRRLEA